MEQNNYNKPTLIKFDKRIKIKYSDLHRFLNQYKFSGNVNVFIYNVMEYGDYNNYVESIIKKISISTDRFKNSSSSIVEQEFWYYRPKTAFWKDETYFSYCNPVKQQPNDVEIEIDGVFIIFNHDLNRYNKNDIIDQENDNNM